VTNARIGQPDAIVKNVRLAVMEMQRRPWAVASAIAMDTAM
jgi:hypothetical protein